MLQYQVGWVPLPEALATTLSLYHYVKTAVLDEIFITTKESILDNGQDSADVIFPVRTATNELYAIDSTGAQPGSTLHSLWNGQRIILHSISYPWMSFRAHMKNLRSVRVGQTSDRIPCVVKWPSRTSATGLKRMTNSDALLDALHAGGRILMCLVPWMLANKKRRSKSSSQSRTKK